MYVRNEDAFVLTWIINFSRTNFRLNTRSRVYFRLDRKQLYHSTIRRSYRRSVGFGVGVRVGVGVCFGVGVGVRVGVGVGVGVSIRVHIPRIASKVT